MDLYAAAVDKLTERYAIRVRRWREDASGCAWRTLLSDGSHANWIEAPYPTSPLTLAVFLHEIGHHAVGLDRFELRCEAEYEAWQWSLQQMRQLNVRPDRDVYERYELGVRYAVFEEMSRGARNLPESLTAFVPQAA
jgi:hypothetical protein